MNPFAWWFGEHNATIVRNCKGTGIFRQSSEIQGEPFCLDERKTLVIRQIFAYHPHDLYLP